MGVKRRTFLKGTGLTLAALGLSDRVGWPGAERYRQALAQPARRKLALLIGINQYPESTWGGSLTSELRGCLTDVALQRQLLVHRFGFAPGDVLTLSDQQATHQGIVEGFLSHLTAQAEVGDVVVVHFSGYGSLVRLAPEDDGDLDPDDPPKLKQTELKQALVPVDGVLPSADHPVLNDFLLDTLKLLLGTLKTQQVTTVLDVGFAQGGPELQGNLRSRTRSVIPTGILGEETLALQDRLRQMQRDRKPSSDFPGLVINATAPGQLAVEGRWQGFSAGMLTYTVTQQLWWAAPKTTLSTVIGNAAAILQQRSSAQQQPQISGTQQYSDSARLPYGTLLSGDTVADGVVTGLGDDGKTVSLWLGGLPGEVLDSYGSSSQFSLVDSQTPILIPADSSDPDDAQAGGAEPPPIPVPPIVQLRNRTGLAAQARLVKPGPLPTVGTRLHELRRVLPRHLDLVVALDQTLERIERVDATSAFSSLAFVAPTQAGEQFADCLFGRVDPTPVTLTAAIPESSSDQPKATDPLQTTVPGQGYGLFSPAKDLIPGTWVNQDEAIKTAVNRLAPRLRTLLAGKLLRMTANQGTSHLAVRAGLEMTAPRERLLLQQETVRVADPLPTSRLANLLNPEDPPLPLSAGDRIRYQVSNFGGRPLYMLLLSFDSGGRAAIRYPSLTNTDTGSDRKGTFDADTAIAAGSVITLPQGDDWVVGAPRTWVETHLVFSVAPFSRTLTALAQVPEATANAQRLAPLPQPLAIVQAILSDLHQASQPAEATETADGNSNTYRLHVDAWASLRFTYQVV